jgi:hypothetical protein
MVDGVPYEPAGASFVYSPVGLQLDRARDKSDRAAVFSRICSDTEAQFTVKRASAHDMGRLVFVRAGLMVGGDLDSNSSALRCGRHRSDTLADVPSAAAPRGWTPAHSIPRLAVRLQTAATPRTRASTAHESP